MLRLSHGGDELVVAPVFGGAIVGWTRNGIDVFRHPSPEAVLNGHPGAMGCFPLVPYCNRIADRRFVWAGRSHGLAPNFGDHPHAIHGVGWHRAWSVEAVSAASVTLFLRHDAVGEGAQAWPFAFDAHLTYALSDVGLTIEMAATNRHAAPAPMGLGVHPYFPRPAGAAVTFQASGVWVNRPDAVPDHHQAVPPAWDHAAGRPVDGPALDNCFTGWSRVAHLPGLVIEADAIFTNLQVFTPAGADFFCVEPVSHAPDSINRDGMTTLAQGQTLRGAIRFSHR